VITHKLSVDSPNSSASSLQEQRNELRYLRHKLLLHYRPLLQQGAGPIRVMARMVSELERQCRERNIPEEIIQSEIVNRTIGDINLRLVTECEGDSGSPGDYRMLAEELGIALPNEDINGYVAPGKTYLWLRDQMQECEQLLLQHNFDLHIYDISATGNPILRTWLAEEMKDWGVSVTTDQVHLGLGAMDSINKVLCGLAQMYREQHVGEIGILFLEPGFAVPEWQALYNWSQLLPGEDAFSLFEKTGIAGVPGSGFGYTDDYVRFSIGVIPVPEVSSQLDHPSIT